MITKERCAELLRGQEWIFAKTMPEFPHDYTLRKNWENDSDFIAVVQFIRDHGVREKWGSRSFVYYYLDGFKYWTMGAAINTTEGKPYSILINRAKA